MIIENNNQAQPYSYQSGDNNQSVRSSWSHGAVSNEPNSQLPGFICSLSPEYAQKFMICQRVLRHNVQNCETL
jgi:hypothetical protein